MVAFDLHNRTSEKSKLFRILYCLMNAKNVKLKVFVFFFFVCFCFFVWVYGISTFVGYLMSNPFFIHITSSISNNSV